ncbi:TetR/AcrR family transcriptional regulator [Antrihabitans sp. YC2-6]|nr:TetR/AcrR family transcriptional regulator [Antrihabitans sp. YC2-6]
MAERSAAPAAVRPTYHSAARDLLRQSILDSVRDLLKERDWSKVSLSDVSKQAGVSRQTLYNEYGSRSGLAQAYAIRLADRFVDQIDKAIWANIGDIRTALSEAVSAFLQESAADPLVQSLLTGEVKPDLLRLVTIDSAPIITHAVGRLVVVFQRSWVDASDDDVRILARSVVRLGLSYVSIPPESEYNVAADLAQLLGPFVESITTADPSR